MAKAAGMTKRRGAAAAEVAGKPRIWEVDAWRGVAIIMMVIYHLMWDLYAFAGVNVALGRGFWFYFQRTTATSFIFLVGVSLMLSYYSAQSSGKGAQGLYWKFFQRGLKIFAIGMTITVVIMIASAFQPGFTGRIDFGILHFIGASIIIAYPFMRIKWPWANLILAALLYTAGRIIETIPAQGMAWVWLGFQPYDYYYLDYFPLIKWFSVVLVGIFVGQTVYAQGWRRFSLPDLSAFFPINLLRFLGRRSLLIYVIHQPILIGLLFLFGLFG
jgi:uncharacterized membrane protein